MGIAFKRIFYRHKAVTTVITALFCVLVLWSIAVISTYIPRKVASKPRQTWLSVTNIGSDSAPENTMLAFKNAFENNNYYGFNSVTMEVFLTRDDVLIVASTDRLYKISDCSDKTARIGDKSLGELLQYNFGYHFKVNGEYPFRNKMNEDVRVLPLAHAISYTLNKSGGTALSYNIIIKDTGARAKAAVERLYEELKYYHVVSLAYVKTNSSSVAKYIDTSFPEIKRAATDAEAYAFYYQFMFNARLDKIKFKTLIVPPYFAGLSYANKNLIGYARDNGITVQFVTDNAKTAKKLSSLGAEYIVTGKPKEIYSALVA